MDAVVVRQRFCEKFNIVVVKLSLINGENHENGNAQEGYKFQYFYIKDKEVRYARYEYYW